MVENVYSEYLSEEEVKILKSTKVEYMPIFDMNSKGITSIEEFYEEYLPPFKTEKINNE